MKFMKNQEGYALLIVLLMVVLFLGLSATFMAGSLSNAKQEKTVDTSNQAVASAEMGVKYFSTDFQRDLKLITKDVSGKTMEKLLALRDCFKSGTDSSCDEQTEITAKEVAIDEEMLNLYVTNIMNKIDQLVLKQGDEFIPFSTDDIVYSIQSATGVKLNQLGEDITAAGVTDTKIDSIEVQLIMEGESDGISKTLQANFNIEVPPTFLNNTNPLTVYTEKKVATEGVKYSDVFKDMPAISCEELLNGLKDKTYTGLIECSLADGENLEDFLEKIILAKLDPKDFTVHTDDFLGNVCTGSPGNVCNNIDFMGITISVSADDVDATNNMNNLIGANLIINGLWSTDNNIQNLGKGGSHQTIVLHELIVLGQFNTMVNSNVVLLGLEEELPNSRAIFNNIGNQADQVLVTGNDKNIGFNVGADSRFCIDIDKFTDKDLNYIKRNFTFSTDKTNEGFLIYYSRDKNKTFVLTPTSTKETAAETAERNKHVLFEPDYTTFLSACGLTIEHTITEMTEVSIVDNIDPGFELDVEY